MSSASASSTASPFPVISADSIGWLSEEQMVEVDRVMIEDLHIELIQMMENAGRNLARLTLALCWPDREPTTAMVLAGSGGNGGGGLVAARHLANAGVNVTIATTRARSEMTPIPAHQLDICERMGLRVVADPAPADVVVDATIGYSLKGAPRGRSLDFITQAPKLAPMIISLDTPSGLDVTTGTAPGECITADATLTLALPKRGLRDAAQVGDLYVGDISVPPSVYTEMGVTGTPDFSGRPIVRITGR